MDDITLPGAEDAMKLGTHLRRRYPELSPTVKRILADKKPRIYDTASALVKTFPY